MYNYTSQNIDEVDIEAVVEVLRSDWITQGPLSQQFEAALADEFQSNYCNVLANGTAGLHLAGCALGWDTNDVVITSPLTFAASANCIAYSGAQPLFVDVLLENHTIDPDKLEQRIKATQKENHNLKSIVAIDFAGHPCEWEAIRRLADLYSLTVINDNCHALGATYYGDKGYAVKYADVVVQSFHPAKHITTGEGGCVLTNDVDVHRQIKCLRDHGIERESLDVNRPWQYDMIDLGYNYRLSDIQSALGLSQLRKLSNYLVRRRQIAAQYDELFSKYDYVELPKRNKYAEHAYHLYVLRLPFREKDSKKKFFDKAYELGINLQVHYIPIHLHSYYQKNYGYRLGDFPIAEKIYGESVSIPLYPALSDNDVINIQGKFKTLLDYAYRKGLV